MKTINLKQGTPEWHEWRSNGIGASDIGTIMGVNPYKTPLQLFNEMCGYKKVDFVNDAMKHGNEQEPLARAWLEKHLGVTLDNFCAEDDELSFMRCSFDGINLVDDMLIEIKCPYSTSSLNALLNDEIPLTYVYQVQWQLAICGFNKGYLAVWNDNQCVLHHINADKDLQAEIKIAALKFWDDFIRGIPPKPIEKDYVDLSENHPDVLEKVDAYKGAMLAKSAADKVIKELKPQIECLGGEHNFILHGLKLTLCGGVARYDYKAMEEDGIDLEKYKKYGSSYHRISIVK